MPMQIVNATTPSELPERLQSQGWALMTPEQLMPWLGATEAELQRVHESWSRLPPDNHLKDGGRYRSRRHSCFTLDVDGQALTQVEHRAHWQPVEYNALHGGIERWFEPMVPAAVALPAWGRRFLTIRSKGSTRWRMTHSSHQPKRVWACNSSRLRTVRASTENAAFTGLTNTG